MLFFRLFRLPSLSAALGLAEISTRALSEESAQRLRRMQIRGAIEQMRVFVAGNTMFAPVLGFQAWGAGVNGLVLTWTAMMLAFSWWLFWAWLGSYKTDGRATHMIRFVNETKVNAALWCLGFALFYPFVDGDDKTVLLVVMVGSLALGTVGFSQAPPAAFWYLGIQSVTLVSVPFGHWLLTGSRQELLLSVLAVVASAAILNSVLERAKAQMRAFKDHEALAQQTEVVDLLLKDYEEQGSEWIWRTDAGGNLVSSPRQVLGLLGIDESALHQTSLLAAISTAVEPEGQADVDKVKDAFAAKSELHNVTLPLRQNSDGALRWIVMKGRAQFEGTRFSGYRGIFADATATVEAKKQTEYLAAHDPLTGTYNRNLVHAKLSELDAGADHALVFLIDLDGFKQVNDGYGHSIGDALLKVVADRLLNVVGEQGIVARLGGDEFLVMCTPKADQMHILHEDLGQKLLRALSEPIVIDQFDIGLSASIGVAKFPNDTDHGPNLLNLADLALYSAKRGGRNRYVTFVKKMQDGLQKRLLVTERLRRAVQLGEVASMYQPQYCAQTGHLVGAEALARWTDAELGFVGPDVFIPIAEETGLIHELGEQLLRNACLDALTWSVQGHGSPPDLAVNLSPVQVMRGNVARMIKSVLAETGFPPERLEIEITEGVLIDDVQATRFLLEELSDAGIKVALDDFGTGYSSLSYVRALPLNRLKIDRSFIFEIEESEAQSIVSAIVGLCDRLNLEVVAEGVESREAVEILRDLGCDVLQGYYFSRPLDAHAFEELTRTDGARKLG